MKASGRIRLRLFGPTAASRATWAGSPRPLSRPRDDGGGYASLSLRGAERRRNPGCWGDPAKMTAHRGLSTSTGKTVLPQGTRQQDSGTAVLPSEFTLFQAIHPAGHAARWTHPTAVSRATRAQRMRTGDIPFRFDIKDVLSRAKQRFNKHVGDVTLNLPFISIAVSPKDKERQVARELVIRLSDRRVLSAWE